MIYDFSCADHPLFLSDIFSALPGALAALAIIAGLAVMGAVLNRSKSFSSYDIYSGWGVVAAVMTVATVCSTKSLPFVTLLLFLMIGLAVVPAVRRHYFTAPYWLLALFPGLLILTAINVTGIAKWDDFSHWVPNALYLFQHDSVPNRLLPQPHSVWPGYPYALPFLTYMASWLLDGFLMQGGAMINFLLLISFASLLAETPAPSSKRPLSMSNIGKMGLALVLVTLANPGFNASFSITSQGDTATTVLIAALALLFWRTANKLREKDQAEVNTLRVPMVWAAVTLVLIKQSDLSLLGLLIIGFLVVATKNRTLKPAFIQALIVILPALVLRSIWQHYVDVNMPANVFTMRTFNAWRFDLLGPILQSMGHELLKKNGLTMMMLAVATYGVTGIFRPATARRDFALMVGVTYVGYLAFLLTVYVGASFEEVEAKRATSFYRYCTHTSLLGITTFWMNAPSMWQGLKKKIRWPLFSVFGIDSPVGRVIGVAFLILFLPLVLVIHSQWLVPRATPAICAIRHFGRQLAEALPDNARIVTLEPETDGLFTYILDLEFGLEEARTNRHHTLGWLIDPIRYKFDKESLADHFKKIDSDPSITTIVVPKVETNSLSIKGYDNAQGPLVLERDGKKWKKLVF